MKLRKEDFQQLKLEDQARLEPFLGGMEKQNSDASFANLYMWKDSICLKYAVVEDGLILSMECGENRALTPPFLKNDSIDIAPYLQAEEDFLQAERGGFLLRAVSERMMEKIVRECPGRYAFEEDRKNFEYVYETERLMTLSGKKYHAKKNHINRFLKEYEYEFQPYTDELYGECIEMQRRWSADKAFSQNYLGVEEKAIDRALKFHRELGLSGCVIKIDGKIEAFSFGQKLREDLALILVEKANQQIQGLYQLINRDFLRYQFYDCAKVNRQEDMDDEGLRKAKMSYHPVEFAKKYLMRLK